LTCVYEHPTCCLRDQELELPTRLVELESTGSRISARLVSGSDLALKTRYTTLSHCWGNVPFFTLTEGNLEQMQQSIPVDRLTRVFQDAMSITLQLGEKYIWIDSLCIIQDSPGCVDWLAESAKMNTIYGNSFLNLAATGFPDGGRPLIPERPRKFEFPEMVLGQKYRIVSANDWDRQVSQAPLHRRAWVLQEQVLAPRILHFTPEQLFWECRMRCYSEDIAQGQYLSMTADGSLKRVAPVVSEGRVSVARRLPW
jgi:hypothetical protein